MRPVPHHHIDDPWTPARTQAGNDLLTAVLVDIPAIVAPAADWARLRTNGRFHGEMARVAEHSGRSWREVMLASISYDLLMLTFGCSTMALATPEGPVLARNLDWWPERELMQASECLESEHSIRATWPGFSGAVTGLSRRGFALAINAVGSAERNRVFGYPVLLWLRHVLDTATDFADAVRMLSEQRLAAPALLTVVGLDNSERVVIERSPNRAQLRYPDGDAPLVTTNDYRLMDVPMMGAHPLVDTSCGRFNALTRQARGLQSHGDDELLACLTHPNVFQSITVQHVIARPSRGELRAWTPV